ncbi:hypothetical protein AMTR_s00059p00208010 [Amborella trichopoda]|uniref:FBD domain-containing protein n=2 Tax=Amborella trichopoda TaxID=13333 RepID=U5D5H9_AMBTC|nr:hypothetical protein AMTR_s00059p00208010 [Amborella trichopoda]
MCVANEEVLLTIGQFCKKITKLKVGGWWMTKEEASAIANSMKNLKTLILDYDLVSKDSLLIISNGCRGLKSLELCGREGVAIDDEIQRSASHLKVFRWENPSSFVYGCLR